MSYVTASYESYSDANYYRSYALHAMCCYNRCADVPLPLCTRQACSAAHMLHARGLLCVLTPTTTTNTLAYPCNEAVSFRNKIGYTLYHKYDDTPCKDFTIGY